MNPIACYTSPTPLDCGPFAGSRSFQAEQTKAGSLSEQRSTDLTITTVEGDTVSLSLTTAMDATAGTYERQSLWGGGAGASRSAYFDFSASRSLTLEIDGELSEAEMEDIRQAVKAIGSMVEDFLSGDLEEMAEDGQLLKELDSIADLQAAFTSERQVVVAERERVEIRDGASEHHGHVRRHGYGRLQRLMNRIDRLTDEMAERVEGFHGRKRHLAASVKDLLGRLRSGESDNAPTDDLGQAVIQTVQSTFVQKIQSVSESSAFNLSYVA